MKFSSSHLTGDVILLYLNFYRTKISCILAEIQVIMYQPPIFAKAPPFYRAHRRLANVSSFFPIFSSFSILILSVRIVILLKYFLILSLILYFYSLSLNKFMKKISIKLIYNRLKKVCQNQMFCFGSRSIAFLPFLC